jgi:hypothetical protein
MISVPNPMTTGLPTAFLLRSRLVAKSAFTGGNGSRGNRAEPIVWRARAGKKHMGGSRSMHFGRGLAFVFDESGAFLRKAWWLAILAGLPFALSEMVRWGDVAPGIQPYLIADLSSVLLDTYLFLVVVRFVAGRQPFGSATAVDAATLRRFGPYALFSIVVGAAQYYVYLVDESARAYWLITAVAVALGALLAPWAVASALGMVRHGPRRSIRMAAPHFLWSVALYGILLALGEGGYWLIGLVQLPIPDIQLAGMTFTFVGYGLQMLVLGSLFVVANQSATIAIALRCGLVPPVDDKALRDTFS